MSAQSDKLLAKILRDALEAQKNVKCPSCSSHNICRVTRGHVGWKECKDCKTTWGEWFD